MKKQDLAYILFNYAFAELDNNKANLPTDPGVDVEFSQKEGYNSRTKDDMPVTQEVMNGILYCATLLFKNQQSGRELNIYDATFSGNIGGYPLDAVVRIYNNDGSYTIYKSLIDDNTYNPAVDDGTHWAIIRNYNNLYKDLSNIDLDGFKNMLVINRISNCIIKGDGDIYYENNRLYAKIEAGSIISLPNGIGSDGKFNNIYYSIYNDRIQEIDTTYLLDGAEYIIMLDIQNNQFNYLDGIDYLRVKNSPLYKYNIIQYDLQKNRLYSNNSVLENNIYFGRFVIDNSNHKILYKSINKLGVAEYDAGYSAIQYTGKSNFLVGFGDGTHDINIGQIGKFVVEVESATQLQIELIRRVGSIETQLERKFVNSVQATSLYLECERFSPCMFRITTDAIASSNNKAYFIPYIR